MTITPDVEKFRLSKGQHTVKGPLAKKASGRFIKGPIPLNWIIRAGKLPCKAMNISLALWYLAGLTKSCQVKLTHKTLKEFSVSPKTAGRLLRQMQSHGLLQIEQNPGRSPVVTINTIGEL